MLLKRFYKPRTKEDEPFVLDYVSLGHTGVAREQNFSTGLVLAAVSEGWMTLGKDTIKVHVEPEDLIYTIKRGPGRWCDQCGAKLDDDALGELARLHVRTAHAGTNKANPAGYSVVNGYECVLDEAQHKRFRVKRPARVVHFPKRKAARNG